MMNDPHFHIAEDGQAENYKKYKKKQWSLFGGQGRRTYAAWGLGSFRSVKRKGEERDNVLHVLCLP